jgi:hypothetical protein
VAAGWLPARAEGAVFCDPQVANASSEGIFGKGPKSWTSSGPRRSTRTYSPTSRRSAEDLDCGLRGNKRSSYIQASASHYGRRDVRRRGRRGRQGDYDYYIYDLVPLGHALYYLSMAKVYDEWINKVTHLREEMREYEEMVSRLKMEKQTEQDEILQELHYIKKRINACRHLHRQDEDGLLLC